MTLNQVVKHLQAIYHKAAYDPHIRKPISYSLYKTWRWCNAYEKETGLEDKERE